MGVLSKRLFWGCLMVSAICLVGGFGLIGRWEIILVFMCAALLGYLLRRGMEDWFPSAMLFFYLLAACIGLLLESAPVWMLVGGTAALASWDLAQFYPRMNEGGRPERVSQLERRHVECLGISLGLGLLMASAGLFIRLQLSFGLMVLIVLLVLGSLYRFYQWVVRRTAQG